jgi:uncharacterized protein YbjT (DUF2867 family)
MRAQYPYGAMLEASTHKWKRRFERLVRVSGMPYTIVSPGWFDYNRPNERKLVFLQGSNGTPKDGVIARRQIAEVLVQSLSSVSATRKTFELVVAEGPARQDLESLFAALDVDVKALQISSSLNITTPILGGDGI